MGVANVVRCGVALGVRTLWQVGWGYELQRRRCRSHGGSILSCSDGTKVFPWKKIERMRA